MKPHKYRAQPTVVDGIRFASMKEARRYSQLKLLEKAGAIGQLELQPKFKLGTDDKPVLLKSDGYPNGRRASYIADFEYYDNEAMEWVVEDVKGMDTPLSKLKRGVVEAQYDIVIRLI